MKWCRSVDFSAGSLEWDYLLAWVVQWLEDYLGQREDLVMLGDGEIQEGSVWEAAMAAAHHEVGNLKVILDRNRIQNDDFCEEQMRMFDIVGKWKSFGWVVKEINGHDMSEILEGLDFLQILMTNQVF